MQRGVSYGPGDRILSLGFLSQGGCWAWTGSRLPGGYSSGISGLEGAALKPRRSLHDSYPDH